LLSCFNQSAPSRTVQEIGCNAQLNCFAANAYCHLLDFSQFFQRLFGARPLPTSHSRSPQLQQITNFDSSFLCCGQ